jgi:hypothetical protein
MQLRSISLNVEWVPRILSLLSCALLPALLAGLPGCSEESAPGESPSTTGGPGGSGGEGGGTTAAPEARPPGAHCSCDADCGGDRAVCLLGICMARAEGRCAAPNTEQGCEPGFRCFDTDMLADTGVCFPPFDPATCAGVQNRFGLCSPVRGDTCDAACGPACTPAGVIPAKAGSACKTDKDCSLANGTCYGDTGQETVPSGWVQGYCVSFGCKSDAQCGPDAGCFPVTSTGTGACMNTCGMDLDCRPGYTCRTLDKKPGSFCSPGCDAAATCPEGFQCMGKICVSEEMGCSQKNPQGWCPDKQWCDNGTCTHQKFTCRSTTDPLEPNDTLATAVNAPPGATEGLTLCGDEDWYRIEVPAKTIVRVGIRFQNPAGDIDLVAYDDKGTLLGARLPGSYPYSYRDQETDTEYYGFYSEKGGAVYYVRAIGYKGAQNAYSLHVDSFPYVDGPSCTDAGFTFDECRGKAPHGEGLLPFPFPDPQDSNVGAMYRSETFSNYRFARRELVMLVRNALLQTIKTFPDTTILSFIDVCQMDGVTPGYDVGVPRHPVTTHDQGGNIDIAYFQTDGSNNGQVICGDGTTEADAFCTPAAAQKHIVDLPRQAYFMAKLYDSPRTRVIGIDQVIGPIIQQAAQKLRDLPDGDPKKITDAEYQGFVGKLSWGTGWPYHQHHIHLSMRWWSQD